MKIPNIKKIINRWKYSSENTTTNINKSTEQLMDILKHRHFYVNSSPAGSSRVQLGDTMKWFKRGMLQKFYNCTIFACQMKMVIVSLKHCEETSLLFLDNK